MNNTLCDYFYISYVDFDGVFSPENVTVDLFYFIIITRKSQKRKWLVNMLFN